MSRKKDIETIVRAVSAIRGVSEEEARRQLERDSARKLRWRRRKFEYANRPIDPELMRQFGEINKESANMLAKLREREIRTHQEHSTVQ